MLFELDDDLAELVAKPDLETIAALEKLAAARREGAHLIHAGRRLLLVLTQSSALSLVAGNLFKMLYNKQATNPRPTDHLGCWIRVSATGPFGWADHEAKRVYRLPISRLTTSLLQRTVILGENLDDAYLYGYLGKVEISRRRLGGLLTASRECMGGGGATTGRAFAELKNTRLVVCIADGDRKWQGAARGATANAIAKRFRKKEDLAHLHVLSVRDAENLIPTRLFREAFADAPEKQADLDAMAVFAASPAGTLLPWLDIKEGLRPHQIPKHESWLKHLPTLERGAYAWERTCRKQCISTKSHCSCRLVPGLGEKALSRFLLLLERKTDKKVAEAFGSDYRGELEEIGRLVLDWTCAPTHPARA